MNCKWCGYPNNRDSARFCSTCAAPLLDSLPLVNFVSGGWLHGRYQIRKVLGTGGMGTVYGALDNNLPGRRVAIKELDPQRISNPLDRQPAEQMFQEEAQTLARLDHPNIVKVSDYFLEGQRQYQVMDFVDGSTLEEVQLRQRTVPEYQMVEWSRQLCDALNYLHTQKPPVIFRDLKPGTIMVDTNGHVKLIDFGIARRFKIGKSKDTQQMGTPGFAPPEQHGTGQTDSRSDIYALCATMYALLTGYDVSASPFQFPPIRTFAPTISQRTEMAITRGLELDPQRRWQSVQELGNWLFGAPVAPGGTAPVGGQPVRLGQPIQPVSSAHTRRYLQRSDRESLTQKLRQTATKLLRGLTSGPRGATRSTDQQQTQMPAGTTTSAPRSSVPTLPPASSGQRSYPMRKMPEKEEIVLSLYAIARAELDENDLAIVGKVYSIQAGVSREILSGFEGQPFDMLTTAPSQPIRFDVVIHAGENIELLTEWHKDLWYYPLNPEPQLVTFQFRVVTSGKNNVSVDFYHTHRWLRTVRLEFESVQPQHQDSVSR